jgi:hypothetical protein
MEPTSPSPEERRRAYRVTPETTAHLRVAVMLEENVATPAQLLDASTGGVGVKLPHLRHGALTAGQRVRVVFASDRLAKPLVLESEVIQARFGRDQPLEAGLAFVDWAAVSASLEPVFRRLFNERRCFRVDPSEEDVERFRIVLRAERGTRSVRAWLRDLSASGVGLWVPQKKVELVQASPHPGAGLVARRILFGGVDSPVTFGERLQLKMHMPGQRDAFVLPVTLRHLAGWAGAVRARVGVELPSERDLPREVQAAILKYVTDRQRHMRQMEAEAKAQEQEQARPLEASGAALRKKR